MKKMTNLRLLLTTLLTLILAPAWLFPVMAAGQDFLCQPTPEDEMGPFYRPGAGYRNSVGTGYLLFGTVKSARDCRPIAEAKLELWLTGPEGFYGDAWRATLQSAVNGTYYFSSHAPPDFGSRRAHIHIKATAEGFVTLVTQHYVQTNAGEALFDLVLLPASKE
jgi:protocatechuate 3,4-dioxygenase beta subunit